MLRHGSHLQNWRRTTCTTGHFPPLKWWNTDVGQATWGITTHETLTFVKRTAGKDRTTSAYVSTFWVGFWFWVNPLARWAAFWWWEWDLSGCCLLFTTDSGYAQKCIFLSGTCEHLVQYQAFSKRIFSLGSNMDYDTSRSGRGNPESCSLSACSVLERSSALLLDVPDSPWTWRTNSGPVVPQQSSAVTLESRPMAGLWK